MKKLFTQRPRLIRSLLLAQLIGISLSCQAQVAGQWKSPQVLFAKTCAYCHDLSQVVGVGPEILGRQLPVEVISFMVRRGKGAMPAFPESQISPSELAALASMIRDSEKSSTGVAR